jgi:hypothetical protein
VNRLLALLAVSLALASWAALARSGRVAGAHLECTTEGDALGSLDITAAGAELTVVETSPADRRTTQKGSAKPEQVFALARGEGATFVIKGEKSAEFGGAVSDAALLVIGPRKGDARQGYLARAGTVFTLDCTR